MSFRIYPETPTTVKALKEWLAKCGCEKTHPSAYGPLLRAPLTRITLQWRAAGHYGLSPFGFAGITQHSPKTVVTRLQTPGTEFLRDINYCTVVFLPIVFPFAGLTTSIAYERGFKDLIKYVLTRKPTVPNLYDARVGVEVSLEKLLEKYGGRDWREHCVRTFNPFVDPETHSPSEEQWAAMKFANTLGLPASLVLKDSPLAVPIDLTPTPTPKRLATNA